MLAAMTFTDAEARIYEELGSTIRGEFVVTGIARTDIHDIFAYDDADTWYKCKVSYDKIDDEADKKKTITQNFLVSATNVKDSFDRIVESLSTLMIDFQITSIIASPIVEIFPYREEDIASPVVKVKPEIEHEPQAIGKIFSASGSDFEDFDEEEEVNEEESELSDEYSDSEEI